jgi:glyoxylase-like metal-dependent hydrolase (beta-lactamase superfamily II)
VSTRFSTREGAFFEPFAEAFPGCDHEPEGGAWRLAFRVYAVEAGDRVVLVDTGAASDSPLRPPWGPPADGHLVDRLRAQAGIEAADVTDVVLTHLHADHVAGSVTAPGEPAFPNADYLVQEAELPSPLAEPIRDRLRVCAGVTDLTAEVRLFPTPGHTPGHQSVVVSTGDDLLVLAGDVFLHEVQLLDPSARYHYDADDEVAQRSRELVLRMLSTGGRLGSAHLLEPYAGLGTAPNVM